MRWLAASMGMLLILNLSPAFCACIDGPAASQRQGETPSKQTACHCSKPAAGTADETQGSQPHSSGQADTCPLCSCAVSTAGGDAHNAVVAKGGSHAPHLLVMITASVYTPLETRFQGVGADPPRRAYRLIPLHLLNSAFLL